jgi:transcriptional regulator with XRE-family HTH domain
MTSTEANYIVFLYFIRQARLDSGLTQQEMAKALKKPQSFVSKYEIGERKLNVIEFIEICKVLTLDSGDFLKQIERKIDETQSEV